MNTRFRLFLILIGALLVAATYTFPQWQRLLEPREETEQIEALASLSPEIRPTFEALPLDQQAAYRQRAIADQQTGLAMVNAALSEPTVVPELNQALPNMSGPVEVATGTFARLDAIRWAEGTVTIYEQADGNKVVHFENFTAVNGPGLRVVLSAIRDVTSALDAPLGASDIDLGPLQGNVGGQNYELPRQVDLQRYNSIVIYSAPLNMIYSIAPI